MKVYAVFEWLKWHGEEFRILIGLYSSPEKADASAAEYRAAWDDGNRLTCEPWEVDTP